MATHRTINKFIKMKEYKGKDKWVIITNGINKFNAFHAPKGSKTFCPESLMIIEAKTQEELFNKVFIEPKKLEEPSLAGLEYHIGCCKAKSMSKLKSAAIKVRARNKDGTFAKDDPSTPDYNEAWVGGKAPGEE